MTPHGNVRAVLMDGDEAVDAEPWVLERYDAATDQPRIQWCVDHGSQVWGVSGVCLAMDCMPEEYVGPCCVVDALVVPLPEVSE